MIFFVLAGFAVGSRRPNRQAWSPALPQKPVGDDSRPAFPFVAAGSSRRTRRSCQTKKSAGRTAGQEVGRLRELLQGALSGRTGESCKKGRGRNWRAGSWPDRGRRVGGAELAHLGELHRIPERYAEGRDWGAALSKKTTSGGWEVWLSSGVC